MYFFAMLNGPLPSNITRSQTAGREDDRQGCREHTDCSREHPTRAGPLDSLWSGRQQILIVETVNSENLHWISDFGKK